MHILYIHQHFAIPKGSTGTRSYEFAQRWIKAGHKVTLISGHYDIGGLQVGRRFVQRQSIEGINVVVVGTTYSNKQSFIRRIISFLCFILFSIYAGLRAKGVDVTYATSTPLTVGIPAMVLKWLKHIPFVFEVRDQWPEIPIEMGIIKNKFLIKILLCLERTIYQQSAAIVALSPGMADGIQSVLKKEKNIAIISNSCDTDVFRPDIGGSKLRKERGWNDKLVLLHFGAMGKANGLEFVIDVAERLKSNADIHFVLVGDGSEKTFLIRRVSQSGLTNVEILSPVPKTELPEIIAACDISMVIFANYFILEHNSANKFFDSLSAGKPILLNYSGWQKDVLEQNNAGFGCKLCDVDEFVEKVLYLNSHRDKSTKMGQNARRIAVEVYNRDKLASEALTVINSVVDR
ncbi:MAG: glycosyltransferase family 4 protein [Planctomycetota bacterium]|jgi:glycosyltransferase involved in cell wall biosynthesis